MNTRRHWTCLTLGLLATASTAALYHVVATAQVKQRVEAALARIPGLHAGSVSVDPWSGRVVVSHLTGHAGASTFSIDSVAFRGPPSVLPQLVTPAHAADGSAVAENIDVDFGTTKLHIPKVEATGTDLTNEALAELFNAKSTTPLAERLSNVRADVVSIPEITAESTAPNLTQKIVNKDIRLEHVEHGKVATYTSGPVTLTMEFTDKSAAMGPVEATIGPGKITNMDVGLYARVMTQPRTDPNEALAPIYDSFEFDGFTAKGKAFSVKGGKVTSGKVSLRPFAMSMSDFQKTVAVAPGGKPTPEQTKKTMMFIADLYESMAFDQVDMKDIVGTYGKEEKGGTFNIARIGFSQFAKASIGEMALDGFNVTGPDVLVKFDTFAMRTFDFKSALETMKTVPFDNPAAMGAVNPRSFIPSLGQILVTGLDLNVPDKKHTGNANGGASDKFKIAKVDIKASDYMLGIPGTMAFVVDHLTLDLPPPRDPQSRQIAEMGYKSVDISSKFGYAWNEASNTLTMTDASVKGEGMGSVSLKGTFGNVTKDLFVGDAAVTQAALLGAAVTQAELKVDNEGLLTKVLETQAKQAGVTVAQLQQGLVTNVRASISQLFGDSTQANAIANAVTTFLKDPKSIQIVAKSAKGFGAADLPLIQNPAELLKRLDIQATAN